MSKHEHHKHARLEKPVWGDAIPPIWGLVLAGGESRRMGSDKSSIEYHGKPHRDFLADLLTEYCAKVFISCHPDRIPETKHAVLKDTFLDLGPYGGVLSAFRFNPNVAWLTVPCDMPLLNQEIIDQLINQRDASKIATCFHDPSTGLPEPLLTIWEPRAYPVLLENLGKGISCLRKTLIKNDPKQIDAADPQVLRNANTPDEAELFRKIC